MKKNLNNNERGDLPSASPFSRYKACPPSHRLGLGIKSEGSDVSRAGDRIHAWLEFDGNDIPLQNHDELWCAKRCLFDRRMLLALIHSDKEVVDHREIRLWDKRKRYSGVPDYVAIADKHALVADYKTGPIAVEHASQNSQLMALSILVKDNYDVDRVTVAVIQPKAGEPTMHTYDGDGLKRARARVNRILRRMKDLTISPKPGASQCRYCTAKPVCPALRSQASELATVKPEALTPANISQVLEKAKAVKELINAVEDRAKYMLKEKPSCIPGWYLKDGSIRRTISNSKQAYTLLADAGLPFDLILSSTNFSLSKLERQFHSHLEDSGDTSSSMESRNQLRELLGDAVQEKQCEPRLTQVES